jgi:adenosine deaminase
MDVATYLRLLPKTELHCHFTSTMGAAHLIALAEREGIALPTTDPARLFDYKDLADFLDGFQSANASMTRREDFELVAYNGVRAAVEAGALRYREYYVNPQYFAANGLTYTDVIEPIITGLRAAQSDLGVGFAIVVAINRRDGARAAAELVETVVAHPHDEVVGIGQDDLTPELTEDPARFTEAYTIAHSAGLKTTAHVGERPIDPPQNVAIAMDVLKVDRIDHGYRIVDSPELVERARDSQIPFACTPVSTTICSGWKLTPDHHIARMVRAGLNVTFSTDDSVFFRTDIAREYTEALPALGLRVDDARRIALAGVEGAFCDEDTKARLRGQFMGEIATLDAVLESR